MCGICGLYQFKNGEEKEVQRAIKRMNNAQKSRGPDDEGISLKTLNNGQILGLGHSRLSILDLSPAGHQPMDYRGIEIVFNGEIYNFLELRKDLEQKGHVFKTHTDTEVILALYAEYGEKSFSMFRGMFAFALWDGVKNKLFLVRDRYGIKPLYYAKTNNGLVFASAVKTIKESGAIELTSNKDAKVYFLTFGSIPLPYTTYNEILSVKAGHFLVIGSEGEIEEKKYYDSFSPFLKKNNDSRGVAVKKIKELLQESVRLHLISDAPLGVFLSGGLDSSALAAISARMRTEPIVTLGIDFKEKEFSEAKYRTDVVDFINQHKSASDQYKSAGCTHREIIISKDDFEKEKGKIFSFMDQPSIDGVNTYFVSQAAKKSGLKVVLSGLGSDEIFMGYHYFKTVKFVRWIQKMVPGFVFNLLPKKGKLGRLQWLREKHPFYSYITLRGIFSPLEIAEILKINEKEVWVAVKKLLDLLPAEKELKKLSSADLQSYFDLSFYMPNQLLKDTDFMSMAHSLEIRVPFLDHILVEYLSGLPAGLKLAGKYPKQLLIDVVSDILPSSVWERPKMGFTFPFEKWIREDSTQSINKLISREHWSHFWALNILNKII